MRAIPLTITLNDSLAKFLLPHLHIFGLNCFRSLSSQGRTASTGGHSYSFTEQEAETAIWTPGLFIPLK